MKHSEGVFEAIGRIDLFYQCWHPDGECKGVLAFVHGFGDHSSHHQSLVTYLIDLGCSFYTFDLRGHGRSPGRRGHINSWEEYRQDVKTFLQLIGDQEPERPLFLMGPSMGGLIVPEYVLHHP